METASLMVGRKYAFRAKRSTVEPMLKVRLLEVVGRGGRVKVVYEDGPHPGLEEYVHARQLVVAWGERKAFLKDEERYARLKRAASEPSDRAVDVAVETILEATGEPEASLLGYGVRISPEALERLMARCGMTEDPLSLHPAAYRDRFGMLNLPPQAAEIIARRFAAAEPENVLMYVQDLEDESKVKGYDPGERIYHQLLREYQPGFALVRQWAGHQREIDDLRKEIGRLRGLIHTAARELESAGSERAAWRLRRAVDGR